VTAAAIDARFTALIADDEEAPREQLKAALLAVCPQLELVAECVNGADAWDAWLEHQPQVCFLDIRMPGLSGIDVARRIAGRTPIAFVTAYGDHAIDAFDAGALDYLVKPVENARVGRMVERLRERVARVVAPDMQAVLEALGRQIRKPPPLEVLQSSQGREVRLIRVDDVAYFEADSRYTRVIHDGGEALIRTPLKELLVLLDDGLFWQIHRSVIVNHRRIATATRIDETHMEVSLRGRPERLPVSRPFQGLFKGQ
jgi:DNA-binding LytR/AlgR family response regulator